MLKQGMVVLLTYYSIQLSEQFLTTQENNFSVFESNLIQKQTCAEAAIIYSLTGCDSMSQLRKITGSKASKEMFSCLSTFPNDVSPESTKVIITLYRHTVVPKDVLELSVVVSGAY